MERWGILEYLHGADSPEDVLLEYRDTIEEIVEVRRRLKNPVSLRDGRPLQANYIKTLHRKEEIHIERAKKYRRLIKALVGYNLLPISKLISGEERSEFIFSLRSMVMFPLLGEVVSCANKFSKEPGIIWGVTERGLERKEEQFNSLIDSLEMAIQVLEKAKLLYIRKASGCSVIDSEEKPDNVVSLNQYKIEKEA